LRKINLSISELYGDIVANLNICLISREFPPETDWGGIGKYTYRLAKGLVQAGNAVHVITQSLAANKVYQDNGIYVHRIPHKSCFMFRGCLREFSLRLEYSQTVYGKLKDIIYKYNIDIVEAPNFSAESFVYSLFKKVPLVIRLHSSFYEVIKNYQWPDTLDRRLSCFLEDTSILRSDLITCSTSICAKAMAQHLDIDYKKIAVIPLGIEMPAEVKYEISFNDSVNVLFVGRLERRKGPHILIQAIPMVLKEVPHAHFTFVGRDTFATSEFSSFEGGKEKSFKEFILRDFPGEYRDKVAFTGYVDNNEVHKYFSSCDIFVAPSLYESFGFIYLEAMSYAKPVIGCWTGGVPEVIVDGKTGVLIPPADPIALSKAIIYLLKNPRLREKIGLEARRYVEKNFTQEIMVENTVRAYRETINKKRNRKSLFVF
jgi:glycosyltransferase involved in cell wall biosynthesis